MRVFKLLLLISTILMMVVIYCFSAQPADDSTVLSNEIGYMTGRIFVKDFDKLDSASQKKYVESADHTIRKLAHGTEYMVLGLLCALTCVTWLRALRRRNIFLVYLLGLGISVLYAVSDEIHQIFVPGRACMFTDVLIDSGGCTAGVFLAVILFHHIVKKEPKVAKKHFKPRRSL